MELDAAIRIAKLNAREESRLKLEIDRRTIPEQGPVSHQEPHMFTTPRRTSLGTPNNLPDGAAPWGFQASVRQMFQLASLLTFCSNTGRKLRVLSGDTMLR